MLGCNDKEGDRYSTDLLPVRVWVQSSYHATPTFDACSCQIAGSMKRVVRSGERLLWRYRLMLLSFSMIVYLKLPASVSLLIYGDLTRNMIVE